MNETPTARSWDRLLSTPTWYALAITATVLSGNRWGIPGLAWLAPIPWLVLAARTKGWRSWLGLASAVLVAQTLVTLKIVTAPLSPLLAPMFSIPAAIGVLLLLIVYRALRRRGGALASLYGLVAVNVLLEQISLAHGEMGAWGVSATALVDDLPLMQLTALGGLPLVGLLMTWVASLTATLLLSDDRRPLVPHVLPLVGVLVAAYGWGAWRLDAALDDDAPTVRVGAVTTTMGLGEGNALPDAAALQENVDHLFARSERAADLDAQVIVWNEAATVVEPEDEAALLDLGRAFARRRGVDLVLAYGVLVSTEPLMLRNEYAWLGSDGTLLEQYAKHHPVPGEPSVRGEAPLDALHRPWGVGVGAICYDYDFPTMSLAHGRLGAGLAVVPSSDWRGIDPYHTAMSRIRGIEGGYAVFRSVRWASSAGYDAYGRTRGFTTATDPDDVLVVSMPVGHVDTLYTRVGYVPLRGLALLVLLGVGVAVARGYRERSA